jgi:hypothetical protein
LWINALNTQLSFVEPNRIFAGDEKPHMPDSAQMKNLTTNPQSGAVAYGRSLAWTVLPVVSAAGELVLTQIII